MATDYLAALDIGSNTVMTLVMQTGSDAKPQVVDEFGEVTQLGAGATTEQGLQDDAMSRSADAAKKQVASLRARYAPLTLVAAATSAVREARNGSAFMARCQEELGLLRPPTILSSLEEAEATFLGAASAFPPGTSFINIDPGGGSTEFSAGEPGQLRHAFSLPIGCVRWRDRFDLGEAFGYNAQESAMLAIFDAIAAADADVSALAAAAGANAALSATGGTAATIGALLVGSPDFYRSRIHRRHCGIVEIADLLDRVAAMDCATRQALPGMPPGRASVFPAGLIIMLNIMCALGHDELIINCHGLRHGLISLLQQGRQAPHLRV